MKTIKIEDATGSLAHYSVKVTEEPVVVTDNGRPVAALFPVEDTDLESLALSTNPAFMSIIESSRKQLREKGGISSAEMRRRLGVDQA